MTVIGRIRVVARRWVWRVIFPMLTTLFLFCALLFPWSWVQWQWLRQIRWWRFRVRVHFWSCVLLCFELSVDRVIWLLSRWVLSSWVTIFSILCSTFPAQKKFSSFKFRISNMSTVSYLFAYSFKIMRMRHPIFPGRAPLDPVRVFYSGSDDTIEQIPYILCLNVRVPKMYEVWSLNAQGVCEVHSFSRVWLFDYFREDTFKTFFFNSQRCRIPFVGRILLNNSAKFICFVHVNFDAEVVIFTPNIFIHDWGTNPTMIYPTVSNITRRTYDPITTESGFVLRYKHERLRLKRVDENHLARIRQDICDNVLNYTCSPTRLLRRSEERRVVSYWIRDY